MHKLSPDKTRIYFTNLNAIRLIAAFLVVIHHVEHAKYREGIPNFWDTGFIEIIGKLGVVMFFVLSGFLISYLLFKEKEVTGTINIPHFYIRRLLKIWPLYFLIVGLAFFVLPSIDSLAVPGVPQSIGDNFLFKLGLYVFFLPNLALKLFSAIPYVSHVWSIGAEEQFYLIWPGLNKHVKNKWILMFGVIGVYLFIKFALMAAPKYPEVKILRGFWESTPIDCMAIGGLFSLIIYEKSKLTERIKAILFKKSVQWTTLIVTTLLIAYAVKIPYLHYEMYALLFGIIIVNFAANDHRIFSMENRVTNYLGKISYGIYMYHPLTIMISIRLLDYAGILTNSLLYFLVILTTVAISTISFEIFEKRFINMKTAYSKIKSGNEARQ